MGGGMDVLLYLNSSCTECGGDLGPPPDAILHIPPPPLPGFLQRANSSPGGSCGAPCGWSDAPAVEYVELPRQAGPAMDETWLLVLISSCAGVLLLGALLALLLLKCRAPRGGKGALTLEGASLGGPTSKGCEAVLYPHNADSRLALWATLTPRGTAHHLTSAPATGPVTPTAPLPAPPPGAAAPNSFDNSAFVDSDADATPESFPLNELVESSPGPRPRVSSPTRIEHPNLPPLNLHPHGRPLRRAALSRHGSDVGSPATPVVL